GEVVHEALPAETTRGPSRRQRVCHPRGHARVDSSHLDCRLHAIKGGGRAVKLSKLIAVAAVCWASHLPAVAQFASGSFADRAAGALMRAGARVLADDMRKAINFELVRRLPDVANKSEDVQAELEAYIHTFPQVLESYLTEAAAAAGSADRL